MLVARATPQSPWTDVRDERLILILFQVGMRISKCLGFRPMDKGRFERRPTLAIVGKDQRPRLVACPDRLGSYPYARGLRSCDRFFPITRVRARQMVKLAAVWAGVTESVYPHLFRHDDAIYRLRATRGPSHCRTTSATVHLA